MDCRHCRTELNQVFVDLATSPPSNAYLQSADAAEREYPLRVLVCHTCWLVQTEDFAAADELFEDDYAYFSSFSTSWLQHAERYVAAMVDRYGLGEQSMVVEVAANDGYLLQYVQKRNIPCLGIEPTDSTARAARDKGIDIVGEFFGVDLARRLVADGHQADLTAANNVLAHVPDINDFVAGFSLILKPHGVSTFEFPHLLPLIDECLFDTIYHEHYSYLSLTAVERVFAANGLTVFDVEELSTHGGSLRVHAQRTDTGTHPVGDAVIELLDREAKAGVTDPSYYEGFQARVDAIAAGLVGFLDRAEADNRTVAAYGAAAKGNTLLNYAGVTAERIEFVVDANPHKQGQFMPGSRIPIVDESTLKERRPDFVLVLPWNLATEISNQLAYVSDWGGELVRAVPRMETLSPGGEA